MTVDPRNQPVPPNAAAPLPPLEPVRLPANEGRAEAELDMTPMVDVTFLLLIFFMVTATFALQKSFEIPAPDPSQPSAESRTLEDIEDDPRFIVVRIDRYNTFHVIAPAWEEEQEAPSKQDLLIKLRAARATRVADQSPTDLLVAAHGECRHEQVVTALDAGVAVGMESVQFVAMEEDESW